MNNFSKKSLTTVVMAFSLLLSFSGHVALAASPATVNLGAAGNFVILAKTGVSATGATSVVGDIGLSPAAATYITGFSLILPAASAFSTSAIITGKVYAPGYADPTASNLTTAVLNMGTAYTDASGRAADVTELGAGNIGGLTLAPGVYKWGTGVTIPTDVTLSGGANDVWIFQIAQNLSVSSAVKITLAGGAQANNVFWVVAGQTTIGTTAMFNGNILDQTSIVLNTGATLNGRALAQAAVTLDANAVTMSTSAAPTPTPTPAPTPTPTPAPTPAPTPTPASYGGSGGSSNSSVSVTSTATPTGAADVVALQARLSGLLVTLQTLKAQGMANPNANAVANANVHASFKRNLALNVIGDDVQALQVWLNTHGHVIASNGPGSVGNETTKFGGLTRSALAKFQAKVGISPASGNFGPLTRAYIQANY